MNICVPATWVALVIATLDPPDVWSAVATPETLKPMIDPTVATAVRRVIVGPVHVVSLLSLVMSLHTSTPTGGIEPPNRRPLWDTATATAAATAWSLANATDGRQDAHSDDDQQHHAREPERDIHQLDQLLKVIGDVDECSGHVLQLTTAQHDERLRR